MSDYFALCRSDENGEFAELDRRMVDTRLAALREQPEFAQLERQNAELLTALRACCGVLSGENMQKSSLVRALELSYVALANAKGEQTAVHSLPDDGGAE